MYVLLRGRLILSCSIEQKEFPAGAVIPGDVLGERECFTDGTRSYSAYATESSELLKIRYNLIPKNENKVAEDTAQFSARARLAICAGGSCLSFLAGREDR